VTIRDDGLAAKTLDLEVLSSCRGAARHHAMLVSSNGHRLAHRAHTE
jgi:hypothetical protein